MYKFTWQCQQQYTVLNLQTICVTLIIIYRIKKHVRDVFCLFVHDSQKPLMK